MRPGWCSGLDVVIAAVLVAVLALSGEWVSVASLTPETLWVYNLVYGPVEAVLLLWVLARLWWLVRSDGGPSSLALLAIGTDVFGLIYSSVWGLVIYPLPFVSALDWLAFVVRMVGLVALCLALLRWRRIPRWVGWVFVVYTASIFVRMALAPVLEAGSAAAGSAAVVSTLWAASLLVLAYALARTVPVKALETSLPPAA